MKHIPPTFRLRRLALVAALLLFAGAASATEPCDDFGECKTLIEINSTDGDIGFHFLGDGDDLVSGKILNPKRKKIFNHKVKLEFAEQFITELFGESAEPLCWDDPEADEDEEIRTLEEFLDLWMAGTYRFRGRNGDGEVQKGETVLTYDLPAAPQEVDFDGATITWDAGDDLGECASADDLDDLVTDGVLWTHPEDVVVDSWEVVLEPDVEDGDLTGTHVFSVRVPGDIMPLAVGVPADYLASLPPNTPVKIEVGAIGGEDNATFSEEDGFCVNEEGDGCEDEDDEEE